MYTLCQLCDTFDFVISSSASGCVCFISVNSTRHPCQSGDGHSDLLAERNAFGLVWGTETVRSNLPIIRQVQSDPLSCFVPRQPQRPLPPGFGLCDGLLSLVLHTLYEVRQLQRVKHFLTGPEVTCLPLSFASFLLQQHENSSGSSCLDPAMFLDLWKTIGNSLARTTPDPDFCSTNGKYNIILIL